jgi:hypothetical protein
MKKTKILKDDNGNKVEVELEKFVEHINRYHKTGTSIHDERGHYFTVNEEFRKRLKKISEIK